MVAPAEALARIPDELSAEDAAPLLCAGITTFNALRESGARPGDLVAILGVGGLGHLGVQFARRMGFETVAIAAARTSAPTPSSSAHTTTSTRPPRTSRGSCAASAARRPSSPPLPRRAR